MTGEEEENYGVELGGPPDPLPPVVTSWTSSRCPLYLGAMLPLSPALEKIFRSHMKMSYHPFFKKTSSGILFLFMRLIDN